MQFNKSQDKPVWDKAIPEPTVKPIDTGKKFDHDKPDWTLVPFKAMEAVVRVLEFGAVKYGRENWHKVSSPMRRYRAAAYRHLNALNEGEWIDQDSGQPHAAHAVCCLLFILWFGAGYDEEA